MTDHKPESPQIVIGWCFDPQSGKLSMVNFELSSNIVYQVAKWALAVIGDGDLTTRKDILVGVEYPERIK